MIRMKDRGAALVEYGMVVGLVAVLAIGSVLALGGEVRGTFETVGQTLSSNLASATGEVAQPSGSAGPVGSGLPATEVLTVASTKLPGIDGVFGYCRHTNCFAQHGTPSITKATNWTIVGLWLDTRPEERDTVTVMIADHRKTALDADHGYELQCNGGPIMPFDSLDYLASEQGAAGTAVTYVKFTAQGAPFASGENSDCEIRPTA